MNEVTNARPISEAIDEVERELNVRKRCFPRWIEEGRVSRTDANDRLARQEAALAYLKAAAEHLEKQAACSETT